MVKQPFLGGLAMPNAIAGYFRGLFLAVGSSKPKRNKAEQSGSLAIKGAVSSAQFT
jgi:hypothetical protein